MLTLNAQSLLYNLLSGERHMTLSSVDEVIGLCRDALEKGTFLHEYSSLVVDNRSD